MSIPSGIQKTFIIGKQSAKGTTAVANTGKVMRRVDGNINLVKQTYESNEKRDDYQTVDMRHGTRMVEGNLNGEVSCGSYKDLLAAFFRSAWAAGATTGAVITIAAADEGTFTRSAGSFITDGFKVGDLVIVSGFNTAANNGQHLITGVTATVLTVATTTLVDEAEGDSVTIAVDGYKLQVPSSGHTNDYFSIEQLFEMGSTDVSELATDVKVGSVSISVQPNANATISFGLMGIDMTSDNTSYFTSPVAATSTAVLTGAQGALYLGGTAVAIVTGVQLDLDGGMQTGAVVGTDLTPDVFVGRIKGSGTLSAYFLDNSLWSSFENEDELTLVLRLQGGTDQSLIVKLPRIKLGGNTKDDPDTGGIVQSIPFTALKYVGSGQHEGTTCVLQDTEINS